MKQLFLIAVCIFSLTGLSFAQPDADSDGVFDMVDLCLDTAIPESVPTKSLGVNRFALTDDDTFFNTKLPKGKGPNKSYSLADTCGCSCEQILLISDDKMKGLWKYGCSSGEMDDFIEYYCEADNDKDGFSVKDGDCDDDDELINPDEEEICDGIDNDCDGQIDEDGACDDFSIVILPDTQYSTVYNPQLFKDQTQWIKDNTEKYNIQYVVHSGDVVQGEVVQDPSINEQWSYAFEAMNIIKDLGYKIMIVPGNHDYNGYKGSGNYREDRYLGNRDNMDDDFADFFEEFSTTLKTNRQSVRPHTEDEVKPNSYERFEANGVNYLVLGLEYTPDNDTVEWADQVIAKGKEDGLNENVIIVTHCYLDKCGDRRGCRNYPIFEDTPNHKASRNNGHDIWDKLGMKHDNIKLILSGHSAYGVAHNVQEVVNGNNSYEVIEIVTDYEREPGWPYTGAGWLRLLSFNHQKSILKVKSLRPKENCQEDLINRCEEDKGAKIVNTGFNIEGWTVCEDDKLTVQTDYTEDPHRKDFEMQYNKK